MSQIIKPSLALGLLLSVLLLALTGCGDVNSQADFNAVSAKHPSTWKPSGHVSAAKSRIESCTECHGANFLGGVSKVACIDCHMGNEEKIHPLQWGPFSYSGHGSYVKQNQNDTTRCANANCHGSTLTGVTGPSCYSCHMGGPLSVHPTDWNSAKSHGNYINTVGAESCKNAACHGPTGQGILNVVPACMACHANF